MSKYTRLRNKVTNLQRDINNIKRNMNQKLKEYQNNSERKINELHNNMNKALKDHDNAMEEKYYRILNDFQQKTISAHNREMSKMRDEYIRLQQELISCEEELKEESQRLKNELEGIKHDIIEKEKKDQNQSDKSIKNLSIKFENFKDIPHEVFFPNKMQNYRNYQYVASNLHENGMYNASVALSESGSMMLDFFKYDIESKLDEWKIAFMNYVNQFEVIRHFIDSSQNRIRLYCGLKLNLSNNHILDYWSNREFSEVLKKLDEHSERICPVQNQGVEKYILSFKENKSDVELLSIEQMEQYINELSYLMLQYNKTCEFAFRNLCSFCNRQKIKDLIIDLLEDNNYDLEKEYCEGVRNGRHVYDDYQYMYKHYISKENYPVTYPDYRERYVVKMGKTSGDLIYFYIYPNIFFNTSTETCNFNFGIKNSIYCEIIPKSIGGLSSVEETWEELDGLLEDKLVENGIYNSDLHLITDSKVKSNMIKIEVNFSSELTDDEKITINNNNMVWKKNIS